ncbi:30S ribosomal protein S12 methylthiotransferase RimO [Clostridium sp. D2Q-11]|uniref:Ribosomal protein uS12 methylthiotransferase RimO n=1 Tax=Anaeromonas frigoriresistens TaxID=2683708 RepID=A0A942UYF7_9FIRM|nr:30S ribosomal protein S12 methylthiotransferase RimO [Anaeromonas frigoriresistens]MBS4539905.1 30S ribosomal protein S12 methylthiotransferase RimO [Anaeromonas frigoriresistens]
MSINIAMVSLGCSKNLVDSELMMGLLDKEGYKIIDELDKANIIIVNTCGFIDAAKEESIDTILEMAEFKNNGVCNMLIVAGCLSERYQEMLIEEMPEIDAIVGTGNIREIAEIIKEYKEEKIIRVGDIHSDYLEEHPRIPLEPGATSYIKISEGCNNYCTYCIIPKLRGKYRSRKIESILEEARELVKRGTREIILIAQDTTKYGIDIYNEYKLPELLDELNKIEDLKWIRILYMYPETFSDSLINSIKNNEKVTNYVDIPIQHISDNVLKRMNRKTNKQTITNLINNLRKEIPNIIIRTTIIVGFPGENQDDFNELSDFIKDIKFDRLGVFSYSKEEDTAASKFEDQIPENIKEERKEILMQIQQNISENLTNKKVGKVYDVIIEEKVQHEDLYIGRTYMDSPEIDGCVYISSTKELEIGSFANVKITESYDYDLKGEIINEFSK